MTRSSIASKPSSKRSRRRSRETLKLVLKTALRQRFTDDTIDISDGFEGNIHIVVVSRVFDKLSERARQAYLWRLIEKSDLTESEKDLITLLFAVSPGELK